ncbi:MAG: phosphoribosylamine--glycine ligase [Nitrospinae bacterium CG11_big_fil_rev_8_21_14_0_20_45_15]|nr:MAG: phosphoribosylamine--glycine ligase [Nitrospinae bacterium CG11_big_fil_rev_8_21_14_0_20_45_15]
MQILVIGSGGREHALVWKIAQSPRVKKIFCAPGNAGTSDQAENIPIPADDIQALLEFALTNQIDLTVVGPEQALVLGIVDLFESKGLRVFGPSRLAAELEGSKAFSKNLMKKYGIPTADYEVFDALEPALEYVDKKSGPQVVKADGLAAGKGVILCSSPAEARDAIQSIMKEKSFGSAGERIVVEEFLVGEEISVLAFADGKNVLALDSAQDHKAAYDGDRGPNTGGMGAYSPAPLLTPALKEQVMREILQPAVDAMAKEGRLFRGILYAGLMLTANGPKTLEFNVRWGDPETQPLLARLKTDLIDLMNASIDGTLDKISAEWAQETAVCVVMAAKGYPESYEKGKIISGIENADKEIGVKVFHAGTKSVSGNILTNGGRVLGVTALGADRDTAIQNAYKAVEKITWDGIHYRKDIGQRPSS